MDRTPTGSADGVGTFDAVDAFDSFLNPPKEEKQKDEGAAESDGDSPEGEPTEDATEGNDAKDGDPSEESEGEEEASEEPPPARSYTVRVDGKEEAVNESELIAGYQRQADYTRKTQSLAEERRLHSTEAEAVRQERADYAALLPKLRKALEAPMGQEPNWEEMRAADPAKAAVAKQRWDEQLQRLRSVAEEEHRVQAQQQTEQKALQDRILREEADKVKTLIPEWKSADVAKREGEEITQMLRDMGFSEDQLHIYDARAMKIAHLASKYLKIQAAKPGLQKKIEAAPVAKPGTGQPKAQPTKHQQAQRKLSRTGKLRDAASVMEAFLT